MNNSAIVSVPVSQSHCIKQGRLILRSASSREIVSAWRTLGDRVIEVELDGLDEEVSCLSELPVGLSMVVKMSPASAAQFYTNTWLSDRFALAALMHVEPGLAVGVKTATAAMVPVILNLEKISEPSELMAVLDYYFHATHLQVPIEFFHSMFLGQLKERPLSLTDIYPESPDGFLYVDESGQVTASGRLAQAGKFFGTVTGGFKVDKESDLYRTLLDLKKAVFLGNSSCATCEAFDLCAGYLRVVDASFNCTPFLKVFASLRAKAGELADDLSKSEALPE